MVRATIDEFNREVPPKLTKTMYDYDSSSPENDSCTGINTNKEDLNQFIEGFPHLEPIHFFLCLSKDNKNKKCCVCPCQYCLLPWRKQFKIDLDETVLYKDTVYTSSGILQHTESKSYGFHQSTAYYIRLQSSKVGPIPKSNAKQSKNAIEIWIMGGGMQQLMEC